jgi:hypothetical protein
MATNYPSVPAVYTGRSVIPRDIFKSGNPEFLPSLATIDGTKTRDPGNDDVTVLRAGLLLGKITSGGKWRNSIIGLTTGDAAAADTTLTVAAATATEVARLITLAAGNVSLKLIGVSVASGTVNVTAVTASAASSTTITLTGAVGVIALTGAIVAPADGAQTPVQLQTKRYPVEVTDFSGTSMDATLPLLKSGDIDVSMIPNYSSLDTSVKAWVKANLKSAGILTFSDDINR